MHFIPLIEYSAADLKANVSVDGPCLLHDGTFALFVSLRGRDGGSMPSASELHWRRDVPDRMRAEPVHVLLRRGSGGVYLGRASFVRTGHPTRDGFKILFRFAEALPEKAWTDLVAAAKAPLPPGPEEAIASLTAQSSSTERIMAMSQFLERWHGPRATIAVEEPMPEALRVLHALAAGRSLFLQHHLVDPQKLACVDGMTIFDVSNDDRAVWAFAEGGRDPAVFLRMGASWLPEAPSLSAFLLQALVLAAVIQAPFAIGHDSVRQSELAKLKRFVLPLELPRRESTKARFFGANAIIGFAIPNGEVFSVRLGARDRAVFDAIEEQIAEWPELGV